MVGQSSAPDRRKPCSLLHCAVIQLDRRSLRRAATTVRLAELCCHVKGRENLWLAVVVTLKRCWTSKDSNATYKPSEGSGELCRAIDLQSRDRQGLNSIPARFSTKEMVKTQEASVHPSATHDNRHCRNDQHVQLLFASQYGVRWRGNGLESVPLRRLELVIKDASGVRFMAASGATGSTAGCQVVELPSPASLLLIHTANHRGSHCLTTG